MQNTNSYNAFTSIPEVNVLINSLNQFMVTIASFLPNLVSALVLILIGKFLAGFSEQMTMKLLQLLGIKKLSEVGQVNQTLKKSGIQTTVSEFIGKTIYWIIFIVFLTAAADILGLTVVVETLNSLIAYVPKVLAAVIVFVITIAAARFVRGLLEATLEQINARYKGLLGAITEGLIIFFGVILAISQLGIDITVITTNLNIIIAGIVATIVVSFGLGSRMIMTNLIAGYYAKQILKKGQEVTIAGENGIIDHITDTTVVLNTKSGQKFIPNQLVIEKGSLT